MSVSITAEGKCILPTPKSYTSHKLGETTSHEAAEMLAPMLLMVTTGVSMMVLPLVILELRRLEALTWIGIGKEGLPRSFAGTLGLCMGNLKVNGAHFASGGTRQVQSQRCSFIKIIS